MPQGAKQNPFESRPAHGSDFLVPPVHFAFVHLNKPIDIAMVGQTVLATGHVRADMVGQSIDFDHPKVIAKLKSWNIKDPMNLLKGKSTHYQTIEELHRANFSSRLIGAVVSRGDNPFDYDWKENDIIVMGGANGLSSRDVDVMDELVTIPTPDDVDFLTVSTVVSALTYHILTKRQLWSKLEKRYTAED